MNRRDFIAFIGAAIACPATAFAEGPARAYRIYWLSTQAQPDPFLEGFREGLRARGYVEGKNVVLELHYAIGNPQALREVATELRRGKVDLALPEVADADDPVAPAERVAPGGHIVVRQLPVTVARLVGRERLVQRRRAVRAVPAARGPRHAAAAALAGRLAAAGGGPA